MTENLQPFSDEHLEARITAYILGEASPFEAAEIETLIANSPELSLFANRLRTLNELLKEAETTSNSPDAEWKISGKRRIALAPVLGPTSIPFPHNENRIRRAAYRAAFGIAAIFLFTIFIKRFVFIPSHIVKESSTTVTYSAMLPESELALKETDEIRSKAPSSVRGVPMSSPLADLAESIPSEPAPKIHLGGQINQSGPIKFKEGMTLRDAVADAGGANEFGSVKRIQVYRDGKATAYDLTNEEMAKLELQPNDTIQIPQKNWYGCGGGRNEVLAASDDITNRKPSAPGNAAAKAIASNTAAPASIPVPDMDVASPTTDLGKGSDFGSGWASSDSAPKDSGIAGLNTERLSPDEFANNVDSVPSTRERAVGQANIADPFAAEDLALSEEAAIHRSNPALTSEHTDNVDEVRRNLYMAQGNFDLGKFDEAKKSYEDTLRIDPYNSAARRGMEKIAAASSDYYRAAYDQTRAELMMQVDKAWELSVPADENNERIGYTYFYNTQNQKADDENQRFSMDLGGGAKRQEAAEPLSMSDLFSEGKDLGGFINYGEPIARDSKGVKTTTKFSEVIQENQKELGFDWILPPVQDSTPLAGDLVEKKQAPLADISQEISAAQEPFSTFSLNISDASFQVASSAVAKGERPDPESIKPEQFYNAVSYDDPTPTTGEPVAAAIDQLAHPVIPGRNLVRMSVRTASTGRAATQPLVLTLLVDQSGSMARADRRGAMDKALAQLATLMQPDDRITVIGFSRTPNLLADSLPGNEAAKLPDIINQASSEGGTNLEQAINLAENLALRHKADGAQNRIVLFTDGAANLGNADPERLAGRVKALRQQDLAFDIAGIGTDDINDQLLSELARHGNGRYYLVGENTGDSLAKQLAGAFRPAAENVKIQVKFNPQRVGNYKLIGFEKDRLKTEDFRNDSVDAAELAADESGTALYQVEPLADGTGEIGELFVRFRDTATGEMVERSWTIPYESQAPAIDKAQPPMQLAALSMLAAQKLQTGPLADAINFRELAPTIAAVKQAYARSPEAQQMITLINALK